MVSVRVVADSDLQQAILLVSYLLKDSSFDETDRQSIIISVSEVVRNVLMYAPEGGYFRADFTGDNFWFSCRDKGPGIENLETILNGSFVSKTGLGAGLLSAQRLMDELEITTSPEGTIIVGHKRTGRSEPRPS